MVFVAFESGSLLDCLVLGGAHGEQVVVEVLHQLNVRMNECVDHFGVKSDTFAE